MLVQFFSIDDLVHERAGVVEPRPRDRGDVRVGLVEDRLGGYDILDLDQPARVTHPGAKGVERRTAIDVGGVYDLLARRCHAKVQELLGQDRSAGQAVRSRLAELTGTLSGARWTVTHWGGPLSHSMVSNPASTSAFSFSASLRSDSTIIPTSSSKL